MAIAVVVPDIRICCWLRLEICSQALLMLPKVNPAILQEFEQALHSTSSEKEQRGYVKTLLANSGD